MSSVDDDRAADTGSGWVIPRAISLALVLTPLAGAVLVLAAVLSAVVPMVYRSLTPDQSGLIPAAREEFSAALKEHQAIVRVAEVCAATIKDDGGRSLTGEPFVSLDVRQPLTNTVPAEASPAAREAPGYLDAALYLSNAIVLARSRFAGEAVTGNLIAQLFEWTIVATGLFTTILISVKSFASPRSRGFFSMAVMAIVLSSFGTAVATLNSFYTPRLAYDKTERSLASLRQLHGTLAGGLMRERAACAEKDGWTGWRQRQIRDLTNTFLAITSTASRLSGSPDEESAVNPVPPNQGKQTPPGVSQAQGARSEGRQ